MIVGVFGCPSATKLSWTFLFEALGAPFLYVSQASAPEVVKPQSKRMFANIRLVLCYDAQAFDGIQRRLINAKHRYCVFVAGNPLLLEDMELPVWDKTDLDKDDVLAFERLTRPSPVFFRMTDQRTIVKNLYMTDTSVVQRCHTLFYRVADKSERAKLQNTVWNYLCGKTSRVPSTGINALDVLLRSEHATKLREHAIIAREIGVERAVAELKADEFELQYLSHKSGDTTIK